MSKEDYVRMSLWAFIATCLKCVFCLFFFSFFQFCRIGGALVAESHWDDVGGNTEEGGMLGKPTSTHPNEELSWGIYSTNQHAQSTASTDCSFCCCRIVYANHKTFLLVSTTVSHSNLHTYFYQITKGSIEKGKSFLKLVILNSKHRI